MMCRRGVPPGLAIIEAPTGDGKTEAAIYLAEHWRRAAGRDGLYLALPTAATSNQMHARYAEFLRRRRPEVRPLLVHGLAWLLDGASPVAGSETNGDADERHVAREWFRTTRRALLAPEGVGTVDQAMLAALHVKHGVLRLLGLSAKVLIIDEVHVRLIHVHHPLPSAALVPGDADPGHPPCHVVFSPEATACGSVRRPAHCRAQQMPIH
jgi:CRISPR-associated endonuclease/helicase Cas3